MIARILYASFCCSLLLITSTKSAGTKTDCKKIDQQKFKELISFSFSGGSQGLAIDLGFVSTDKKVLKFKVDGCEFQLKETKTQEHGSKSIGKQPDKRSLGSLKPCTKYKVMMKVQNLVTKKEFSYENVVYTKINATVHKLELKLGKIDSDSAAFSWKPLTASCITKHRLQVRVKDSESVFDSEDVKNGSVTVRDLSMCDIYTATVTAFTGSAEKIASQQQIFRLKSNKTVENLKLIVSDVTSDSVSLSWSADSAACMLEYKINLRDGDDRVVSTTNVFTNSTVISELNSCSNYSAELIALDDEKSTISAVNQIFVTHSPPIEDIAINVDHASAIITWKPLIKFGCIANYSLTYSIEGCLPDNADNISCSQTKVVGRTHKTFTFHKLPQSEQFSFTFYVNEVTSSGIQTRLADERGFNTISYGRFFVDNVKEFRNLSSKLLLRWSLGKSFYKALKHFEVQFDGKTLTTTEPQILLDIAPCKRNYTIEIWCIAKDDKKGPPVTHTTNLHDDEVALSSLENKIYYHQKDESVMISWTPSSGEEDCIAHYEINMSDQSFKMEINQVELNQLAPCKTFAMEITPISLHGKSGLPTTFEFTTKEFLPKAPTNLTLVEATGKELKLSATISKNDQLCSSTQVEFTCNALSFDGDLDRFGEKFVASVTGLSPFTNYNCSAHVRNLVGASESTEVQIFSTSQEAPQPPRDLRYSENEDGSIAVDWQVDDSTGIAELFNVHVTLNELSSDICDDDSSTERSKTLQTKEKFYELQNLKPFSRYSIRITAKNEFGFSEFSEALEFDTNPSKPSPIREFSIVFESTGNDSQVDGILIWKAPCNLNGIFSSYAINVTGKKGKFEEVLSDELTESENITLSGLDRGTELSITIQANNEGVDGEPVNFLFFTPSGPPLEQDLQNWSTLGQNDQTYDGNQIDVFIKRGIFVSEAGQITGIAFLIASDNDCFSLPTTEHGLRSKLNTSLPSSYEAKNGLECFKLYQQTNVFPNPITQSHQIGDENANDYNIKFVIGNENCEAVVLTVSKSFCNGELKHGKYAIIARVFTDEGFRDTKPVHIEVRMRFDTLVSTSTIVCSAVGLILFMSLLIAVCCYMSHQKKEKLEKKRKEAAEADENLLSFTSYCVIDRNPKTKVYED